MLRGVTSPLFIKKPAILGSALVGALLASFCVHAAAPPPPLLPVPSRSQLEWYDADLTVFVHFGMNTFTGKSTGSGSEDPDLFNPSKLDCTQWVKAAQSCGFKGFILTAKHHDGFCLWPTATTKHSVASSSWKDGKGDVVRELSDACRAAGLKFGVYCSPWDRSQTNYDSNKPAYAKLYRQQLTELLSNYGPVYELWLDGNKANVADWPNIINVARTLQPDAIIKQGPRLEPIREDVRWVGNELACAPLANWAVYPPPDVSTEANRIWFPLECDTPMIGHWFWADTLPLELPALLNYYYTSIGRGSILLLNIAPNREGLFSPESVSRMQEFHAAIRQIFGTDLAVGSRATASNVRGNNPAFDPTRVADGKPDTFWAVDDGLTNAWVEVDLGAERRFNVVRLEEMISLGQRVAEYQLEVWNSSDHTWKVVNKGFTIGNRKLDRIPTVASSKLRLTILKSRACPVIKSIGLHLDTISPAEHFAPAFANAEAVKGTRMPRQTPLPGAGAAAGGMPAK